MQKKYFSEQERQEANRARARAWYYANQERAKARVLAHHHTTKLLVGRRRGERHPNWSGDAVSYHALHLWVSRSLGQRRHCDHCQTTTASIYDWANKDHRYRRDLNDWMRLCRSCHRKHDRRVLGMKLPWERVA